MILALAYYGNPILRKKCVRVEAINDEIRQLIKDMEETMHAHDGIGIACPQVGKNLSLFLMNVPNQIGPNKWEDAITRIVINPKIIEYSPEEMPRGEGCISIPQLYGNVYRPVRIKVEYTNISGEQVNEELSGLEARCFMHENDHINGVLFIDRIRGKEREEIELELRAVKKKFSGQK